MADIDPYEILGVPRDATPEDIKKAHRAKAKATHPDAGGQEADAEKFAMVSRAWLVLQDPERRAEYDRTGRFEQTHIDPTRAMAMDMLGSMVMHAISMIDVQFDNLVDQITDLLTARRQEVLRVIQENERHIKKFSDARDRTSAKGPETAVIDLLKGQIRQMQQANSQNSVQIAAIDLAVTLAADFVYRQDERPKNDGPLWPTAAAWAQANRKMDGEGIRFFFDDGRPNVEADDEN